MSSGTVSWAIMVALMESVGGFGLDALARLWGPPGTPCGSLSATEGSGDQGAFPPSLSHNEELVIS